jgi:phosphoglycolate phosphatase-like HAD superfamily hydrolase
MSWPVAAIFDVDGTLVDSTYHHVLAWARAFHRHGFGPPLWEIHRSIGMGGDKLVAALAGEDAEVASGDAIRQVHEDEFVPLLPEIRGFAGVRTLFVQLHAAGIPAVLASSGTGEQLSHYIDLLDIRSLILGWVSADDVASSKPSPDLVSAGLDRLGTETAVMVGDSTWDILAAARVRLPTHAVRTGGTGEGELEAAGAAMVVKDVRQLLQVWSGASHAPASPMVRRGP